LTNSTLGSELAINITDGKLFYKDNANAIQVIGWKVTPATAGGTGQTSYAVGDILYADTTTSLAKLADVATGNALISGGVGVAPSWGKIGLTTHVSGTLAVGNGGTGVTTLTGLAYGNGTSAFTAATAAQVVSVISTTAVTNSTNAANITITDDNSTNATYYPVWVTGTGNKAPYISSTSALTWNPLFAQLGNGGINYIGYSAVAKGGTAGSTIGALNFMGSANANVAPVLEVRQQRGDQDVLVTTSNQTIYAYLLRIQENGTDKFVVRGTGTGFGVGIGTATPGYQLELSADSAGKPSTNTWTITSDSRVKNVVREFTKGLDAICGLRPVVYKYNGLAGFKDTESENISIIADEAKEFLPEDIGTYKAKLRPTDTEDTELLNWKGHAVIFALVNSVKELKRELDEVKQQLKGQQ
jgi:hypothetical protein